MVLIRRLGFIAALLWVVIGSQSLAAQPAVRTPYAEVPSDVFLVLVNQISGRSEIVSLGVTAAELKDRATYRIDPSWRRHLGDEDVTYQLVAGDVSRQAPLGYGGNVLYASSVKAELKAGFTNLFLMRALSSVDGFLLGITQWKSVSGFQTMLSNGAAAQNWGPANARPIAPGRNLGIPFLDCAVKVGDAVDFVEYAAGEQDDPDAPVIARRIGRFHFKGDRLTYTKN
jgi:hypothetical protein